MFAFLPKSFVISRIFLIFASDIEERVKLMSMKTVQDYIAIVRQHCSKITNDFGIKSLRIFGSVSRNDI